MTRRVTEYATLDQKPAGEQTKIMQKLQRWASDYKDGLQKYGECCVINGQAADATPVLQSLL